MDRDIYRMSATAMAPEELFDHMAQAHILRVAARDYVVAEARAAGLDVTTLSLPDETSAGFGLWLCRGSGKCIVLDWDKSRFQARLLSEGQLRHHEHATGETVFAACFALIQTGKVPASMLRT